MRVEFRVGGGVVCRLEIKSAVCGFLDAMRCDAMRLGNIGDGVDVGFSGAECVSVVKGRRWRFGVISGLRHMFPIYSTSSNLTTLTHLDTMDNQSP